MTGDLTESAHAAAGNDHHDHDHSSAVPRSIGDYGLLADCNGAALVSLAGSIDWLCLPRYDSPALFARLLDPEGGHWSITPVGDHRVERRYLPGTLVLETTFITPTGRVRLIDALAFAEGQRVHCGMHSTLWRTHFIHHALHTSSLHLSWLQFASRQQHFQM